MTNIRVFVCVFRVCIFKYLSVQEMHGTHAVMRHVAIIFILNPYSNSISRKTEEIITQK